MTLPIVVQTAKDLNEMLARLRGEPRLAVDTEADSLYSYYEKVCLIQISIPSYDYVLDTLALRAIEPLGELFADPRIELVFHAAEYDILLLKRDFGFEFQNIFDTMLAARILGWKQVGLRHILAQHFGVTLDKRFQRANWGKRPLTREQLEYARDDTHYLLALYALQHAELQARGLLEEARAAFARLSQVTWSEREFDPQRYATLPGARELAPSQLGALRELYQLRETLARQADRPPFKILGNATLLRLARTQPRTLSELRAVPGIGEWFVRRHGHEALRAIARGIAYPQLRLPKPRARGTPWLPDAAARARLAQLKQWRRARAERRGVTPDVILSNEALLALARANPQTPEELSQLPALTAWAIQEYGEELLALLKKSK